MLLRWKRKVPRKKIGNNFRGWELWQFEISQECHLTFKLVTTKYECYRNLSFPGHPIFLMTNEAFITDFVKTLHKNSEHLYMKPLIRFVLFVTSPFDPSHSENDTLVEIIKPHHVIHYLNNSQNIYRKLSFSIKYCNGCSVTNVFFLLLVKSQLFYFFLGAL